MASLYLSLVPCMSIILPQAGLSKIACLTMIAMTDPPSDVVQVSLAPDGMSILPTPQQSMASQPQLGMPMHFGNPTPVHGMQQSFFSLPQPGQPAQAPTTSEPGPPPPGEPKAPAPLVQQSREGAPSQEAANGGLGGMSFTELLRDGAS